MDKIVNLDRAALSWYNADVPVIMQVLFLFVLGAAIGFFASLILEKVKARAK